MKSLKELYRIGKGPSSSHTMGPQKAAQTFAAHNKDAKSFEVTLYGSLAATGRGHMTDVAIDEVLRPIAPLSIVWQPKVFLPYHPNGMKFVAFDAEGNRMDEWICYSVGGGALSEGEKSRWFNNKREVYQKNTLHEIQQWCENHGRGYWEYVDECEDEDIWDYLMVVWRAMQEAVERGIDHEGALPGPLKLPRKGPIYYVKASGYKQSLQSRALVYAYALSVSEANPHLRFVRRIASRALPPCKGTQIQRHTHTARPRHSRHLRQRGEAERLNLGCRCGLSGRGGRSVRHGFCSSLPAIRRQSVADRICSRNGIGAPPRHDVRPGVRTGSDSVYRAQRFRRYSRSRCQPLCVILRRNTQRVVRPRGEGNEADRPRPAVALQGDKYGRTGAGLRAAHAQVGGASKLERRGYQ